MAQQESMNLVDFVKRFQNDDACPQYLYKMRWPEGFKCPVFCYRLNRRRWVNQLFPRLLNACVSSSTLTLAELIG
jgi:hypothetical protein